MSETAKKIYLSIIIPIYNNFNQANRLISSLNNEINNEIEIIVVDDGSKLDFKNELKIKNLQIIKTANKGPSSARNLASNYANGEYLLFLDSDTSMASGMLSKILDLIKEKDHDVISIYYSDIPSIKGYSQNFKAFFDHFNNVYNQRSGYIKSLHGSSCVFKKDIFIKSKGWNTDFKHASLENEEFANRLVNSNIKVYFDKDLHVIHEFPNFPNLLKVIFLRSMSWVQLKIQKKVQYDNLVRTPFKGLIASLSFIIVFSFFIGLYYKFFQITTILLLATYLFCNFDFYKYLFKKVKILNLFIYTVFLFIFHFVVTTGAILGICLHRIYKVKI